MKKIYKYPLRVVETQKIELPYGSVILKVGEQFGELFLWAIVETESEVPLIERIICMFDTGNELPENIDWVYNYIDTVIRENGLVCHIFEPIKNDYFDTNK